MKPSEVIQDCRRQMLAAAERLIQSGGVSQSRHGNMSLRVPGAELILLTTPRLSGIGMDDLPLLDLRGRVIEGHLDPTAHEIVHMHTEVYGKRPDLASVIHTHAPYSTAFAVASRPIECVYEGLARRGVIEPVPVAGYAPRGSDAAVGNILDVITERTKCVLLENHGILTFDRSLDDATHLVLSLEEAAMMSILAGTLGGAKVIPPELAGASQERMLKFQARGVVRGDGQGKEHDHG